MYSEFITYEGNNVGELQAQEQSRTFEIVLNNSSDETIKITKIGTSCGCTEVSKLTEIPSEGTILELKYDRMQIPGEFSKSIFLYYDDKNLDRTRIVLKGNIK